MKKLLFLSMIFAFSLFYSQSKVVDPKTFESSENDVLSGLHGDVKIIMKDGNENDVSVFFEFMSSKSEFENIEYTKVDKMLVLSRNEILRHLKNKYSFNPKKVTITFDNLRNSWAVIWEYVAKNAYGGEVVENQVVLYDNNLKRIDL